MPADACDAPRPGDRMSRTVTEAPRCASDSATAAPMTPAPMTMTFTLKGYRMPAWGLGVRNSGRRGCLSPLTCVLSFALCPLPFALFSSLRAEIVPVQHRVEPEEVVPVRLVAPEGTRREDHHVALAHRRIDQRGLAREILSADELA